MTEASLAGLLTVTPLEELDEECAAAAFPTVRVRFVSHEVPFAPHDFTCSVCVPAAAVTWTVSDLLSTTAVFAPLSSE